MLRRLLFAAILVNWSERSFFQIQTIIFKCSLMMIYTGYIRPMKLRQANCLELINDSLIVVCSYWLIIFSAHVSSAEARYISSWPLIGIMTILVAINLTVITFRGITSIFRACKLRVLKNK